MAKAKSSPPQVGGPHILAGFFPWDFGTLFARFRQADGDGLLSTLDFAAFTPLARLKCPMFFPSHGALYTFACRFAVLAAAGFAARTFLGCHCSSRRLED